MNKRVRSTRPPAPLLGRQDERHAFLQYNYAKYRQAQGDPSGVWAGRAKYLRD